MEILDIDKEIRELQNEETKVQKDIRAVDSKIRFYKNFAWSLIGIGLLMGILGLAEHLLGGDMNLNEIGDYTGGVVASTWSLAGLFIIYVAFLGQKQQMIQQKLELKYNRFEVRVTRNELEGQKLQMIQQNTTMKQQRFENTFFQMVNLHHQIVNGIDIGETKGRDCFKLLFTTVKEQFKVKKTFEKKEKLDLESTLQLYLNIYHNNISDFGHYFRNLYTILNFINYSNINDKRKYSDILRAQLSSHELLLLFFNGLTSYGIDKLKPLMEKYGLLKNVPQGELNDVEYEGKYSNSVFGL